MSKRKNKKSVLLIEPLPMRTSDPPVIHRILEVEDPTLEQLQEWVAGYIELIPAGKQAINNMLKQHIGREFKTTPVMYGNEEGYVQGLPVNWLATWIMQAGGVAYPPGGARGTFVLVGALKE